MVEKDKKNKIMSKEKILKDVKKLSPIDLEKTKQAMKFYIFDEDKIIKNRIFSQSKLNEQIFCFGLLLTKEIDLKDKKGNVVGKEQEESPVIITSKKELIEATKEVEIDYKIKFNPIPSHLPLRWSRESIENFLKDEDIQPDLSPEEVFSKVKKPYEDFCFFREPTWYKVNALLDMDTYCFSLFDTFPIKEERGLQGTGKTKCMKVSKNISCNATEIMINPSEATLFRETHDKRPTKYIDEAEKLFTIKKGQVESDSRVELINGSCSRGSVIPRMEKIGNRFVCVYYQVFSPTRIGSIKGLFGATEDRTITQIHTRSPDNDARGETEPDDNNPEWIILRDYLYLFTLKYWKKIEDAYRNESLYKDLKLKKRDLQIWKPLLALAEVINHELFLEINTFAEKISLQRREDFITEDSWDFKILKIVLEKLESGENMIRPKEIKEKYKQKYSEESERSPHEKTIIKILDQVGFKDLRKPRDNKGNYYLITKENFSLIINPICPILSTLSTLPTLPTLPLYNKDKNSVGEVKESVGKKSESVADVENVASVGNKRWKENKESTKIPIIKIKSAQDSKNKGGVEKPKK